MNKWCGKIGFFVNEEVIKDGRKTGVWKSRIEERKYYGDMMADYRKIENSAYSTNGNININNKLSILSDRYLNDNLMDIKYIEFKGQKFTVQAIDTINSPRIIMTLGGVYHESKT